MNRRFVPLLALVLSAAAATALAQSGGASSTGSIQGRVRDNTGAVLPGVTVSITGPSMIGVQTAVTSTDGVYRFPGVPAGTYRVTYEMNGFSTLVRENIRIGIGFTALPVPNLSSRHTECAALREGRTCRSAHAESAR